MRLSQRKPLVLSKRWIAGSLAPLGALVAHAGAARALARGLPSYDAADAARIAGHRSEELEAILGWRGRDEMIHRDALVVL
jgi:glutamate 5-kinase